MNTFYILGNLITIYVIFLQWGVIGDPTFKEMKKNSFKNFLCAFALLTQVNSIYFDLIQPIWQSILK